MAESIAAPGGDLDLRDPEVVIDLFIRAGQFNLRDPVRYGACVELSGPGRLLMTGDLHDNGLNFHRILKLARLDESHDNRLVLHEVIHGPARINGRDLSIRMLARVAALKTLYPEQVFLLQSNHELAQLIGEPIVKDSHSVIESFDAGVDFLYDDRADDVRAAMNTYLRSLPLAVRCDNGVFCCHSLPSPRKIEQFDKTILDRVPTDHDLRQTRGGSGGSEATTPQGGAAGGSAYHMVWGRHHNQKVADELAQAWRTRVFVMGHQPAEMGYETEADTILILASDHDHGVALPIDLARSYNRDELIGELIPLASVVL
jgi:hypothetical protein